jgi:hypothetical protein
MGLISLSDHHFAAIRAVLALGLALLHLALPTILDLSRYILLLLT